jgi:hypothetical protein
VCIAQEQTSPARLVHELTSVLGAERRLIEMAANAQTLGLPDAARTVARDLLILAGIEKAVLPGLEEQARRPRPPNLSRMPISEAH